MSEASPSIASTQLSAQGNLSTQLKTMQATSPSPSVAKALDKPNPRDIRFAVCVLMLCGMGAAMLVCQTVLALHLPGLSLFAQLGVLLLGAYMYEWTWVHSHGLTRFRRAYFDETNVLETYQPRARTHGHLFVPEPSTPAPQSGEGKEVFFGEDTEDHTVAQNSLFNQARDVLYVNEFQRALQMAKELENVNVVSAAAQDVAPGAGINSVPIEESTMKSESSKEQKKSEGNDKPSLL